MSSQPNLLDKVISHPHLWQWVGLSIAGGAIAGLFVVLLIVIRRRKQVVNSLIALEDCIGLPALVEVPFDENTSGKVNIQLDNQTLACFAYSSHAHRYLAGDEVVIVGIKGKKVWVIPAQEFHQE